MTESSGRTATSASQRAVAPKPPRRARNWGASAAKHALLVSTSLVLLYPLIWLVVSSFRPTNEIFLHPGLVFSDLDVSNYVRGWHALASPFERYILNSLLIVVGAVIGNLLSCSLTAYAFARLQFRGKRLWFAVMLSSIMLPIHVVIIPQYILFSGMGWVDTFLPLIVPKFLATDAFFIFLMVQFIRGIPVELDEAARLDGCGHFAIFRRIILPLMVPALAATAIFTFIWTWNDFFSQLVYLSDQQKLTVPLALQSFMDSTGTSEWGPMFAMSAVSLAPLFIVFLFGQRYLIQGISTTGGK